MTDHDLAALIREHVRSDEPPFLMSAETPIALGRRTLVRRRARRGLAGVLVAAAAIAAVPLVPWHGSAGSGDRTGVDPATAAVLEHYDARKMAAHVQTTAGGTFARWLAPLGLATFTAADDQGEALPPSLYDKASSMSVVFGGDGDHRVSVTLLHARSEAEGDARKNCARDLAGGIDFSCTVSTSPAGDTVTTVVRALRPSHELGVGWGLLTRQELSAGVANGTSPGGSGPIDLAEVYFARTVESVHSDTFLTSAEEIVRAPDVATAERLWRVPVADLESLVTDPTLVIPKPPLGPGGCPWTWKAKVTCSRTTG
jgi:hypothetical protein